MSNRSHDVGRRLWPILMGAFLLCSLSGQALAHVGDRARELAYFGDVDELRTTCGDVMTLAALEKTSGTSADVLFQEAVQGEAWGVISLLAEYGWPDRYPNVESWYYFLSPRAVTEMARRMPDFREKIGSPLMRYASSRGNVELMQALKAVGVPLNQPATVLASSAAGRDLQAIHWLLEIGVDPGEGGPESAIQVARQLKSADLLQLLDPKKVLSAEVAAMRAEHAPGQMELAGFWAYRKDGFGSMVLVLYPDGTGTFIGDAGSYAILWKGDADGVSVFDLPRPGIAQREAIRFISDQSVLILRDAKGAEKVRLAREGEAYGSRTRPDLRVRPRHVRIKTVLYDSNGLLWIQLNGAYVSVEVSRLVEGAKASPYGREINSMNTLDWESFVPGELPKKSENDYAPVSIDQRTADPGYSIHWDELYLTHGKPAELKAGAKYTLFRGLPGPVRYGKNPQSETEYPDAFALLSQEPFSNGKHWLLFFLRKGRADHSLP